MMALDEARRILKRGPRPGAEAYCEYAGAAARIYVNHTADKERRLTRDAALAADVEEEVDLEALARLERMVAQIGARLNAINERLSSEQDPENSDPAQELPLDREDIEARARKRAASDGKRMKTIVRDSKRFWKNHG